MRMLVLGSGNQGTACAFDLLSTTEANVTLADYRLGSLPSFLEDFKGERLTLQQVDVRDEALTRELIEGHDAVMSAVPYYFNFDLAKLAVDAGAHFSDLGGNTEIVRQQETLNDKAVSQGVSVVVDCGLAPGMVNILAADGIARVGKAASVKLFVGGLPQNPEPPLNYQIVYSLEGALDYYTTPSWVVRDGKPVEVDPLSELEDVVFPDPVGTLEAFHTAGGLSTMPWEFENEVETMEYKTLRYPGHAHIMHAIRELGLLNDETLDVKGTEVVPRDVFIAAVDPKLRKPEGQDLVALRVAVKGENGSTVSYSLLDRYDATHGISAMMRTTGYSLAITGQMQVAGDAGGPGVRPAFKGIDAAKYITALAQRGIKIEIEES